MRTFLLNGESFKGVESLNLLKIEFLSPKIDLSKFDYLIFTSKNAVRAIDRLDRAWREKNSLAVGVKTAKEIEKFGGRVEYIASKFYGDEFAKEILEIAKFKTLLYIRAKRVASNLIKILKSNSIDIEDIVLYQSICQKLKSLSFPKESIFIFTSPSIVECFFESFSWQNSYRAIAIGESTAKAFPKTIEPFISPTQTIEGCIKFSQNLR